ncbi:MAG: hypothetical protein L0H64_19785 [Pseudonocardia sp.]|nr:hypothetical protein [Pseudonocardia sp.]
MSEEIVDALEESLAHGVLQDVGPGVHVLRRGTEHRDNELLDQPMRTDYRHRVPLPVIGQLDPVGRGPHDEVVDGQPVEHGRHRRRGHVEQLSERTGGGRTPACPEVEDRFEMVLGRPDVRS